MMKSNKSVLILIPAYNEGPRILATLAGLKQVSSDLAVGYGATTRILVVDDFSADDTYQKAKTAGVEVIRHGHNQGKGGALNTGLSYFHEDVLLILDADVQESSREVTKLIVPVLVDQADMTIAKFPRAKKKGGFGLVKGLARWGIKKMAGLEVEAPLSGQRAMTKAVVNHIGRFASGYGVEVALTIDLARQGFRLTEIEVQMSHRETGRDLAGFMHRGKQFYHVGRVLLQKALKR